MFRITINTGDSREIWDLEGSLSGDWVAELERCWRERPSSQGTALQINLKAVTYIDAKGKQLLKDMHGRGVEIKGCGCMVRAVVEEITRHASVLWPRESPE
jgi:anti-anti-sigma regulatory factor